MEVVSASSSTTPPLPAWIFLSHSGQQKGVFVTHLYHALRNAKHRPFFDIDFADSLPVGLDYPPRIFQACHDCKLAVVVLSEDYVKSLWPMLELQHLLLPSRSDRLIYPLFYQLKPGDLSNPAKLESWQAGWAQHAEDWHIKMQRLQEYMSSTGSEVQIKLDIESWPDNLSKLQCRSGSVRHVFHADHERSFYESDYEYIRAIVSNICASFPPPTEYSLEVGVVGQARMQQEIRKVFQQEGSFGGDGVGTIGVHGIGGIGKSTLCKMMVNFYGSEFPGRCFYLEFPSNGNDFLKILKSMLKAMAYTAKDVANIDQAMGALEKALQIKEFFLAIDNIWGNAMQLEAHESFEYTKSFEHALRIMRMEFAPGTKIMLTSRSKEILSWLIESRPAMFDMMRDSALFRPRVVHVPTLTRAEAVEALKSHNGYRSSFIPEDCLRRLARSCFFEGQCHPLYLKLKGVELEQKGRASFTDQQWRDLISSLEVRGGGNSERAVLCTVEKSLDALRADLQDIFIDLATWPSFQGLSLWQEDSISLPTFLRYHYDDYTEEAMFFNVLELQHHGLVEVDSDPDNRIVIHDLLKLVAKSRVSLSHVNSVAKYAIFDEDLSLVTLTDKQLLEKWHISGRKLKASSWRTLFGSSTMFSSAISMLKRSNPVTVQIRGLLIDDSSLGSPAVVPIWRRYFMPNLWRLCLKNNGRDMKALRVLHLERIKELREIEGWEGVPNLMFLTLCRLDGLERIGSIGCLERLERFALLECENLEVQVLVGAPGARSLVKPGDKLPLLQHLTIYDCWGLTEVGRHLFDAFPALKVLRLRSCWRLQSFPDLNSGNLLILDLSNCIELSSIDGISVSSLTALQRLELRGCCNLKCMSDISELKSSHLRVLDAYSCPSVLGNQLRLMMLASCCHDRLRELRLSMCIPSGRYVNGTDEVVRDIINDEWKASSSYAAASSIPALRLGDVLSSCDLRSSDSWRRPQLLNEGMAHFVRLQRLEISAELEDECRCSLDVSGLPGNLENLTLAGFGSVQKLVISSSLVYLQELELRDFSELEEISGLGAHHAQVARIMISGCPSLVEIFGGEGQLTGLRELHVSDCSKLAELPSLGVLSPSLGWLRIDQCGSLTDVSGVTGLTNLQSLDLTNCTSLTDVSVVASLTNLQSLDLRMCTALTDVSGVAGLTNLQSLDLTKCTSLTDVSGVAGLTNLQSLDLRKCTALRQIPRLTHLRELEISDPGSYRETLHSDEEEYWHETMSDRVNEEMSLEDLLELSPR